MGITAGALFIFRIVLCTLYPENVEGHFDPIRGFGVALSGSVEANEIVTYPNFPSKKHINLCLSGALKLGACSDWEHSKAHVEQLQGALL